MVVLVPEAQVFGDPIRIVIEAEQLPRESDCDRMESGRASLTNSQLDDRPACSEDCLAEDGAVSIVPAASASKQGVDSATPGLETFH